MFRALSAINKGELEEGFESSSYSEWVKNQTKTFSTQLPNAYPSLMETNKPPSEILKNSKFSLASWDPNTRQTSIRDIDLANYATTLNYSKEILDLQAKCKSNTLDNLINTENPNAKLRCGWIYQKSTTGYNPKVSQASLGTRNGPIKFEDTPSGTWYWGLEDAKKQILTDRCNSLNSCSDVGQPSFANCAFSTSRGIGVPVDNQGNLLYPRDSRLTAPSGSLVRNSNQCPRPPPPGSPQYELARSRDICTPLPNGKLSRDCVLQQITAAGCKTDGALYRSLVTSATPVNYAAGLENNVAFQKYQRLAQPPLLDDVIKSGQTTKNIALANFQKLSANTSGPYSELTFAARDLCTQNGALEGYDFCNELTDLSSAPFALQCLQRAFRQAGGQPAGSEYPTNSNISSWNSLGNWKAVNDKIEILKSQTTNSDAKKQAEALKNFLGIQPDILAGAQVPKMNGLESFWFNRAVNGFMGRRVEPNKNTPCLSGGATIYAGCGYGYGSKSEFDKQCGQLSRTYNIVASGQPNNDPCTLQREAPLYLCQQYAYTSDAARREQCMAFGGGDGGIIKWIGDGLKSQLEPSKFPGDNWGGGDVAKTGKTDMVEFIAMTNLRPPTDQDVRLRVETDDGMIVTLNSRDVAKDSRGRYASTETEFSLNWDQAPTSHTANTCWKLRRNGPNYVNVWWQETYGGAWSKTFYKSCNGPDGWQNIPSEWFTMTQEPDAPMLSFQLVVGNFIERRLPTFFPIRNLNNLFTSIPETGDFLFNSNNSYLSVNRLILLNSFRTLAISFKTTQTSKGVLLDLGGTLVIEVNGPAATISWNGRSLQVKHTFPMVLDTIGRLNYIYINFKSTYQNTYPDTLTIAAGTQTDFSSGRVNVRTLGENVKSFTTNNNDALYDAQNDYAELRLGAIGNAPRSLAVKNIRFFDYELYNEQITRDIKDDWEMKFPVS